jgi:hypothetical protein
MITGSLLTSYLRHRAIVPGTHIDIVEENTDIPKRVSISQTQSANFLVRYFYACLIPAADAQEVC